MKRMIGIVALATWLAGAAQAQAQESAAAPEQTTPEEAPPNGSLGFHQIDAPLGIRWWFGPKVGLDLGLGYTSNEAGDERFSSYTIDAGVPIALKRWSRLNFILRPGILYSSQQVDVEPGPGVTKENDTGLAVLAELEAEVFLADRLSVSAAHGFGFFTEDPAVGESTTDYGTIGSNFSHIGFHLYLWGGQ
jgi:hypothetical protein